MPGVMKRGGKHKEESDSDADVDIDMDDREGDTADAEGFFAGEVRMDGLDDEAGLTSFLQAKGSAKQGVDLKELLLQKMTAKDRGETDGDFGEMCDLSPKVIQAYAQVGKFLKMYKSGKLPKAFKVVPTLRNWEEVLFLTNPLEWSAGACLQATKIFASNLNPFMAQRFFNLVLLPAVRENIENNRKLSFAYYEALKRALFKPAAWFKGILIPLSQESCTLREAVVVGSVLAKVSIPMAHAGAALIKLCQQTPWYGTTSIFISFLLNKRYALADKVVAEVVRHFCSFRRDERQLPVVWHASLLTFVQHYKLALTTKQRGDLLELVRTHCHPGIGPEVRRELSPQQPAGAEK